MVGGGAPKPSKKAAQAAATAPSSKAVFIAADLINLAALTPVPTSPPAVLPANVSVVSLAIPNGGGTVLNETFTGNFTFDASKNLSQVDTTSPTRTIKPVNFASTNSSDGIISWGQADAGTTYNTTSIDRYDYIAGATPNPANLVGITGTYNVFGSSSPFLVSGASANTVGLANAVNGSLNFNFSTYTFGYNINVPTTINGTFNLTGNGGLTPAGTFATTGIVTNPTACVVACTGAFNGGSLVQGAFFGANGERAGLQYGINAPSLNGQVYGGTVLK